MKLKKIVMMFALFGLYFINTIRATVKGDYVVTSQNDTVEVVVNEYGCDGNLFLKCKVNGKKTTFFPENTLYYKQGVENYESAFVATKENGSKKWHFLKRENHEKLVVLIMASTTTNYPSGSTYQSHQYYCRKPNDSKEKLVSIFNLSDLYELCSDCPKLIELLKSENPKWDTSIWGTLQYYFNNQNCK